LFLLCFALIRIDSICFCLRELGVVGAEDIEIDLKSGIAYLSAADHRGMSFLFHSVCTFHIDTLHQFIFDNIFFFLSKKEVIC
jgi:hypothetical protein